MWTLWVGLSIKITHTFVDKNLICTSTIIRYGHGFRQKKFIWIVKKSFYTPISNKRGRYIISYNSQPLIVDRTSNFIVLLTFFHIIYYEITFHNVSAEVSFYHYLLEIYLLYRFQVVYNVEHNFTKRPFLCNFTLKKCFLDQKHH